MERSKVLIGLMILSVLFLGLNRANHTKNSVYSRTYVSVVQLSGIDSKNLLHYGTGFFVKTDKNVLILTAGHVCNDKTNIRFTYDNFVSEVLTVAKSGPIQDDICVIVYNSDIALIKKGKFLRLSKEKPTTFDALYTVGYPSMTLYAQSGIMLPNDKLRPNYFQDLSYNFHITPGASGSPIVNENGEVVSIITAYEEESPNRAFGVSYNQLIEFTKEF